MDVAEEELHGLYSWVDSIPLSRPKRNISRDFSDGVLLAEIVAHYYPKLVELHNYSAASSMCTKRYNWNTLNAKIFKRLRFSLPQEECEACASGVPGAIERVLKLLQVKIAKYKSLPPKVQQKEEPSPQGRAAKDNKSPCSTQQSHVRGVEQVQNENQHPNAREWEEMEEELVDLRQTNEILEKKVRKLEQLIRIKDAKIEHMTKRMEIAGLT